MHVQPNCRCLQIWPAGYLCGSEAHCELGRHCRLEYRRMVSKSTGLLVVLASLWQVTVHIDKHSASTAYRSDEDHYTHTYSRFL